MAKIGDLSKMYFSEKGKCGAIPLHICGSFDVGVNSKYILKIRSMTNRKGKYRKSGNYVAAFWLPWQHNLNKIFIEYPCRVRHFEPFNLTT